jgi:hypothetical protein
LTTPPDLPRSPYYRDVVDQLQLGLFPQSPIAPDGITVADLVSRGRCPHQGWFRRRWTDRAPTPWPAGWTRPAPADLIDRPLRQLSGGLRLSSLTGFPSSKLTRFPTLSRSEIIFGASVDILTPSDSTTDGYRRR